MCGICVRGRIAVDLLAQWSVGDFVWKDGRPE
jgi:hypothetical protein